MILVKIVKITCVLLWLMFTSVYAMGQQVSTARTLGLGGATSALQGLESIFTNPSAIDPGTTGGVIATSSMPFNIPEFLYSAVGARINAGANQYVFASISNLGTGAYRDTDIRLGYARRLFDVLQISIDLSTGIEYFEGYATRVHLGYGIGFHYEVSNEFALGTYIKDLIPVPVGLPPRPSFVLGARYSPSDKSRLFGDVILEMERHSRYAMGVEYDISNILTLRCGVSTYPSKFHLGASLTCTKSIAINMAMSYHITLGVSPSFDITFAFR